MRAALAPLVVRQRVARSVCGALGAADPVPPQPAWWPRGDQIVRPLGYVDGCEADSDARYDHRRVLD